MLSAILYRHLFSAGLSWIDDHEFASYLDQNGNLGFIRIFSALANETELKKCHRQPEISANLFLYTCNRNISLSSECSPKVHCQNFSQ